MYTQYITRKGSFDSAHRIMNERVKCFNIHGHRFSYELCFGFNQIESIGYALDFQEIKRVGVQWIEDTLDHLIILNPHDFELIETAHAIESRVWLMSLNGEAQYCNPTIENLAKEIFLALEILFEERPHVHLHQVRLFETRHCFTDCFAQSISPQEKTHFLQARKELIQAYAKAKGVVEYDNRKR